MTMTIILAHFLFFLQEGDGIQLVESHVVDVETVSFLKIYNGANIFEGLHIRVLNLFNEHDVRVRRRIFPFSFGSMKTFGAF